VIIYEENLTLAILMVTRNIACSPQINYLLVDSWYTKPMLIQEIHTLRLQVNTRIANKNKIWDFKVKNTIHVENR